MKPILVTGAAGFIGSCFVEDCNRKNIPVVSVDYQIAFSSRPEHAHLDFGRKIEVDQLFSWLDQESPQFSSIVHMGACSSTTELNMDFLRRVNIEYSQKLWDYATRQRIPFVYASSAATYGDGSQGYDDDESQITELKPLNPYGESKRLFDLWALEQEKQGRCPPCWSGHKFFNVYGFGERHKGPQASVVLHAFDQIKRTGAVRLFKSHRDGIADGHQKRDFVYVADVVRVLDFAIKHPIPRGIYNVGTGKARTFLDLVRAVFHALGAPENIEFVDTPAGIRERYQYFTEARMNRLLSLSYRDPFTSLEDGVSEYIRMLRNASA